MEMTIKEATSVLSGIVHNLRAAKRLEGALKVVEAIEQLEREGLGRKDKLLSEVEKLASYLKELKEEIEEEEGKRESALAETGRLKTEAQADLQRVKADAEKGVAEVKASSERQIKELKDFTKKEILGLNNNITSKEEELKVVLSKLETANADLVAIKERLG